LAVLRREQYLPNLFLYPRLREAPPCCMSSSSTFQRDLLSWHQRFLCCPFLIVCRFCIGREMFFRSNNRECKSIFQGFQFQDIYIFAYLTTHKLSAIYYRKSIYSFTSICSQTVWTISSIRNRRVLVSAALQGLQYAVSLYTFLSVPRQARLGIVRSGVPPNSPDSGLCCILLFHVLIVLNFIRKDNLRIPNMDRSSLEAIFCMVRVG